MKNFNLFLLYTTLVTVSFPVFANIDISGKWRTIDDKTGFSKGIVEIRKEANNTYSGKIIEVIPRPGYTPKTICDQCTGHLKNKPILGLTILQDMKASAKNPSEYAGGTILDPLSGKLYKSTLRVNPNGTRITMRGYVGVEAIGRSQTWIKDN
ncbi:DUF2147 domain-containing protein [Acinetobacter qingfengensis]|uniref:Signal peptidase n=1 Tax=Acinetobacter qingfengensis TaxID=1262585 RepID=A0A1E7RF35_9GAMM|nr:DUF2147 domain-containing protein [Acinetobacter qingfengensis]KAA8731868.1 DUF2147 domain-containing protein [Acinetobacter qingfengensis]OEY98009.1 signal peptidase [Acinetobacter qingfengensis]